MAVWESLAGTAIVIAIIVSGIAIGIGKALRNKKLERFGMEEIIQSIVNAALLGGAILISTCVTTIGSELISYSPMNMTNITNATPAQMALLMYNNSTAELSSLSYQLLRLETTLAYYQTISIDLGNVSFQPLKGFEAVEPLLSINIFINTCLQLFLFALSNLLQFVDGAWFGAVFAIGLIFRSFFFSRKFGSTIMCLALSFILIYPFFLLLVPQPVEKIIQLRQNISYFLDNETSPPPSPIQLTTNGTLGDVLYNMSFGLEENGTIYLERVHGITTATVEVHAEALLYYMFLPIIIGLFVVLLGREAGQALATTPIGVDII